MMTVLLTLSLWSLQAALFELDLKRANPPSGMAPDGFDLEAQKAGQIVQRNDVILIA